MTSSYGIQAPGHRAASVRSLASSSGFVGHASDLDGLSVYLCCPRFSRFEYIKSTAQRCGVIEISGHRAAYFFPKVASFLFCPASNNGETSHTPHSASSRLGRIGSFDRYDPKFSPLRSYPIVQDVFRHLQCIAGSVLTFYQVLASR